MKNNVINYPHPVLGINGGILPDLPNDNMVCNSVTTTADEYVYNFTLKFANKQIQDYIDSKPKAFAEFVCEVDCPKSMYKRKFSLGSNPTFDIRLPKKDVIGHVDFRFFVVALYAMPKYSNSNFNPDFYDAENECFPSFELIKGDVLVHFSPFSDNVQPSDDKKAALVSFIQIVKGDDDLQTLNIKLDQDIIDVELPVAQFEKFCYYNKEEYRGIFYTSLIFNALVYAILNIADHDTRDWADSIRKLMEEPRFDKLDLEDPTDAVNIAITMLSNDEYGDPYDLLYKSLDNLTDAE